MGKTMGDYFTRLAARSLSQDRPLRPRLAPLLGPPAFDATWTAEASLDATSEDVEIPPTNAADDAPRTPPRPGPIQKTAWVPPQIAPTEPTAVLAAMLAPTPAAWTPQHPASESGEPAIEPARDEPRPRPTGRVAVASERVIVETIPGATDVEPAPEPPRGGPLSFATPMPTRPPTPGSPRVQARPAEPQGPVIQVTIGRVEVRATTDAAPARPPRQPASRGPSLEEYLRQGRRGGT